MKNTHCSCCRVRAGEKDTTPATLTEGGEPLDSASRSSSSSSSSSDSGSSSSGNYDSPASLNATCIIVARCLTDFQQVPHGVSLI